jgi:hypothetical protein
VLSRVELPSEEGEPAEISRVAVPRLSSLFPKAVAAPNILYAGFTNANVMLHVANCVANAGRIESADAYKSMCRASRCAPLRSLDARSHATAGRKVRRHRR